MKWNVGKSLILVPLALAIACGGKSDAPSTPGSSSAGKEKSCAEFCKLVAACDGSSVEDCTDECVSNDATSRAGQEVINECFAEVDCSQELDQTALLGALICLPAELQDLELSATQQLYCDEAVPKILDCSASDAASSPFASCDTTIGLASDEVLEDMIRCSEKPCEQMQTCLGFELLPLVGDLLLTANDPEAAANSLSPASLVSLLAVAAIAGPWASEDTAGIDIGTLLTGGTPDGSGGVPVEEPPSGGAGASGL